MTDRYPKPGVERRDLAPCAACGQPLLKQRGGPPTLQAYRVELDMLMLDVVAVRQYHGVMAILGADNAFTDRIAEAMAPDTELLKCLDTISGVVCQPCYFHRAPVDLAMSIRKRREEPQKGGA